MILPVASVVTEKTICEFDLLKLTLEQYHNCEWAISCDKEAYEKYGSEWWVGLEKDNPKLMDKLSFYDQS